jgi:hypothetical protein
MQIGKTECWLKLHGISISGLAVEHRAFIEEYGLKAWLEQQEIQPDTKKSPAPSPTTLQPNTEFSGKRCALGAKCFKAKNRQPTYCRGTANWCSKICRGAAQAAKKRDRAKFEAENPGMVV